MPTTRASRSKGLGVRGIAGEGAPEQGRPPKRARKAASAAADAKGKQAAAAQAASVRSGDARDDGKGGARKKLDFPSSANSQVLLDLGQTQEVRLVKRPSASIKSPYVADVCLSSGEAHLAHVPMLDMGGLVVPGSELITTAATNPDAKTSMYVQLVKVHEPECGATGTCTVGAHPSLGNKLVGEALRRGLVQIPDVEGFGEGGCVELVPEVNVTPSMRVDFVARSGGTGRRVAVEVKNVVCADYDPATMPAPPADEKQAKRTCLFSGPRSPYVRSGIFPWGVKNQEWEGKKVVSERAIKHLRELVVLAERWKASPDSDAPRPVLLMLVNRGDCERMRACHEACSVYAEHFRRARNEGVAILAYRIRWEGGKAIWDGQVPIDFDYDAL